MTIAPLSLVGKAVTVPWGCWDPDTTLELSFPQRFTMQVNGMRDGRQLSAPALANAVRQPLDSRPLRELAAATRTAAIAVDDITRPTPIAKVLPIVLSELEGIAPQNIKILVALGAHRPMVRAELERKLGAAIVDEFDIEQHHPYENLVDLGRSSRVRRSA